MKVIKYIQNNSINPLLLDFLKKNYCKEKNFDLFLDDYIRSYQFCINNRNIKFVPLAVFSGKEMKAHVALIVDRRLTKNTAFFGFFEIIEDTSLFRLLWNELIREAKKYKIDTLKGPVNGSIWHQYRSISFSDGSDFFKSELMCSSHYNSFLSSIKPKREIKYYSARREKFDNILDKIEVKDEKIESHGFRIRVVEKIDFQELIQIALLSKNVFSNSWGFTELTKEEFLNLYSSDKIEKNLNKLYLLYKNDQIIGYCSTVKEDDATLICKTICILPVYQGLGLGNALAYKVHVDAVKDGFKKIIYALIREDNKIKNFPKIDAEIIRRYSAFEFGV